MRTHELPPRPRLSFWTLFTTTVFLTLFVLWLGVYQVEEVTRVPGVLEPTVGNAPIQFPGSGLISELLVKEGQNVKAGEVLLKIDPLSSTDTVESLKEQVAVLEAQRVRLSALSRSVPLTATALAAVRADLAANQRLLYAGEISSYQASLAVFASQIRSLELQVQEKQAELASLDRDIKLANEELSIQNGLAKEGMASRTQVIALERELEALSSRKTSLPLTIAQLQQDTQGVASKQTEFVQNHLRDYKKELARIEEELGVLRAQMNSGERTNQHMELKSPIDGTVSGLTKRRTGETVSVNELLMDIIPMHQTFLANLKIPSQSVGYLKIGLPVTVILDAYAQEPRATLKGTLSDLSIASQLDEKGIPFYKGVVAIDASQVTLQRGNFPLLSGMSLKSQIFTGQRTLLQFIFSSIIRSSSEAFRER